MDFEWIWNGIPMEFHEKFQWMSNGFRMKLDRGTLCMVNVIELIIKVRAMPPGRVRKADLNADAIQRSAGRRG